MKNVCLIFIGTGYKSCFQSKIKIYDLCNNLIYKGYTYNGVLLTKLCEKKIYKIVATLENKETIFVFRVDKRRSYYFVFNRILMERSILLKNKTFSLTDVYYKNLPIERGELILWQNQ